MNLSVRTGDTVMVISGKDKGKTGKILKVIPETGRIYVEGINIVSKSKKPRSAQDKGGILKVEGKIDASNVMVVCPDCGDVIRVAHKIVETKDGKSKSIRVCPKCGVALDEKKVSAKKAAKKAAKKKTTTKTEEKTEE